MHFTQVIFGLSLTILKVEIILYNVSINIRENKRYILILIYLENGAEQMKLRLLMLRQGFDEERITNLQRFLVDRHATADEVSEVCMKFGDAMQPNKENVLKNVYQELGKGKF